MKQFLICKKLQNEFQNKQPFQVFAPARLVMMWSSNESGK